MTAPAAPPARESRVRPPGSDRIRAALDSPWFRKRATLLLVGAAVIGTAIGAWGTWVHLTTDPLADVRAYYDAGARLNAGQPLYDQPASTNAAGFYRYPPLVAIAFRPLALLPYPAAAGIWGVAMVLCFLLLIRRIGTGPRALVVMGMFALGLGWSLAIGQAHVLTTLLVSLGTPLAVALAANIKVFPAIVGLYWLGRRDWAALGRLAGWGLAMLALQFALEPGATRDYLTFLNLEQVGEVYNLSPYAISPLAWALFAALLVAATLWFARGRFGWAVAVAAATLISPRLLVYQLSGLVAGVRAPGEPRAPGLREWWAARGGATRTRGAAAPR